ncbi:MAG: hypothetical protein ACYCSF_05065 [Acidimicrobiales bacterium]
MARTPGYRVRSVGTLAAPGDPTPQPVFSGTPAPGAPGDGVAPKLGSGKDPDAAADPTRPGQRARPGGPTALVLVAVLGVVGTIGFGTAWALGNGGNQTNPAVTTSARNLVLALTNFDPGTVSADFSRVEQDATGAFGQQARKVFGSSIRKELATAHAASRGTIEDLYVQSASSTHATVFAVVSQTYLNSKTTSPVRDTLRMVMGLEDVNGIWKTSSVKVLEGPVSSIGAKP